jgi:hypothetical protein
MTEPDLLGPFLDAIAERWRPADTWPLLGLFQGLIVCRVDDCSRTASGIYELGELRLPLCPECLVQVALGRLTRRSR